MLEELTEILSKICDVDGMNITESTSLYMDIGLASIDYLTLVNDIEDRFGVRIPDNVLLKLSTVGDIIKVINEKRR